MGRITRDELLRIKGEDIKFVAMAELGAMGAPGEIDFVAARDGKARVYTFSYAEEIPLTGEVAKLFPMLCDRNISSICYSEDEWSDKSWVHDHLGFGNHLFVRRELFDEFVTRVRGEGITEIHELYGAWIRIATEILNGTPAKLQ